MVSNRLNWLDISKRVAILSQESIIVFIVLRYIKNSVNRIAKTNIL